MLPHPRTTDHTALQEIALLYFKQLEGKIRSHCRLMESSISLTEIVEENRELIYLYRAFFRCSKTFRIRRVGLKQSGKVAFEDYGRKQARVYIKDK